jgi:hypothetical protein
MNTEFKPEILKKRYHLGDIRVDGRIILKLIIHNMAEDKDQWLALVDKVNNFRGLLKKGTSWVTISFSRGNLLRQMFTNFYTLRPPQDFALIYAPPRGKHIKYYIWNINNVILLKRPSSNT